jgi:hypothetical protein
VLGVRASGERAHTDAVTDRRVLLAALERAADGGGCVDRLCRAAVGLLDARGAVLTCAPQGPVRFTACATDEIAARLMEIEELVEDGPSAQAVGSGRSVGTLLGAPVPPTQRGSDEPGYALLAREVVATGAPVAVRAWPVRTAAGPVAVLTVHGPAALHGPERVHDGQVLADALAPAVLATGPAYGPARRAHQAVGMVVAQTGLPPQDAAALLRARAWVRGEPVADVVAAVLERRLTLAEDDRTS